MGNCCAKVTTHSSIEIKVEVKVNPKSESENHKARKA